MYMEILYLLSVNLFTFAVYGEDKRRAAKHLWRIPEHTLFVLALLGGSVGALAGMYVFRHKTRKMKFRMGIPLIVICQLAAAVWIYPLLRI